METLKAFLNEDFLSVQAPILLIGIGFLYFTIVSIRKWKKEK